MCPGVEAVRFGKSGSDAMSGGGPGGPRPHRPRPRARRRLPRMARLVHRLDHPGPRACRRPVRGPDLRFRLRRPRRTCERALRPASAATSRPWSSSRPVPRSRARLPPGAWSIWPANTGPSRSSTRSSPASAWLPAAPASATASSRTCPATARRSATACRSPPSAGLVDSCGSFEDIFFSGTHGGEALSLAAARAVLDAIADGTVLADIEAKGTAARGAALQPRSAGHGLSGPRHGRRRAPARRRGVRRRRPAVDQELGTADHAEAGFLFNGSMFVCARHTDDDVAALDGFDSACATSPPPVTTSRRRLAGDRCEPVFRAP